MSRLIALARLGLVLIAFAMCIGCPVHLTDHVFTPAIVAANNQPFVGTIFQQVGQVDTVNNCAPVVPPTPTDSLNSSIADEVIVGREDWRNTTDSCQESRIRIFRGYVAFNTASMSGQANFVNRAELDFDTDSTPTATGGGPIPVCAGGLGMVIDDWPQGGPKMLNGFTQPFPRVANSTMTPTIPFPSTIPSATMTQGAVTLTPTGHFSVDVTKYALVWLQNFLANKGVALLSTNETTGPLPVPTNAACRSHYGNFVLHIFAVQ
jgi:hypothetical protein